MPKHIPFILAATLLTLSTLTSCRKVYDYIRDHPDAHDTLCRVTKLTYGVIPPGSPFIGGFEVGITYNAKGNPDSVLLLHKPVPYFGLEQYFRYDRFDRLTDFILNYAGGLDPLPYVPSAIIWHKYAYPRPGIITDTTFAYETAPVNGPPPIAKPGQAISIYKFDGAGKMIAIAETTNTPNLPPPVFNAVAYDARGNGDLGGRTDIVYDNNVNVYRTNKIWQFVYKDYSRNNLTYTGTAPVNQFGLPTQLPLIYLGPGSNFYGYFSSTNAYNIEYACSAPKGPINY